MKQPYDFFLEYLTLRPQARETANISRCMQAAFRYYGYISPNNQWHEDKFLDGYTIQSLDRALREVKKTEGWQDNRSKELEKSYREMYSTVPRNEASISKGIKVQEEAKNVSEMKLEGNTGKVESNVLGNININHVKDELNHAANHSKRMELIRKEIKDKLRV